MHSPVKLPPLWFPRWEKDPHPPGLPREDAAGWEWMRGGTQLRNSLLTLTETLLPRISLGLRGPVASFLPVFSTSARFLMRRVCHEHDFLLYQKMHQSKWQVRAERGGGWAGHPWVSQQRGAPVRPRLQRPHA